MFRFEHPDHLYILATLPVLALLFVLAWQWRRRAVRRFGQEEAVTKLSPHYTFSKSVFKLCLWLGALALLSIAMANPQWGTKREKTKRQGIDVFIALDVSRSMLSQDVLPSRLARAQRFGQDLINKLKGEQVGVLVFACNAQLHVPLTTDYAFAQLFLGSASPEVTISQGTAIAGVIELAQQAFPEDNQRHKALIILTDGEDHEGSAAAAAKSANDEGLVTFTVGVGTEEGGFVPVPRVTGEDYLHDAQGQPVRTRMDSKGLQEIAQSGGGAYFDLGAGADAVLSTLQKRIDSIEKRAYETRAFSEHESYFQYFLAAAMLLLLVEFAISFRKSRYWGKKDIFGA